MYRTKARHRPMRRLTDSAWRTNMKILLHWRVGSMRLGCRGYPRRVVEPSIQSPLWRPAFVQRSAAASLRDCSDLHGDQTFSCFLASVVVQPLCTVELLPDSLTLRNDCPSSPPFWPCVHLALRNQGHLAVDVRCLLLLYSATSSDMVREHRLATLCPIQIHP